MVSSIIKKMNSMSPKLQPVISKRLSVVPIPHKIGEEALPDLPRPSTAQAPSMLDIGTREIFDTRHDSLRQSARTFFNQRVKPFHNQWETEGIAPRHVYTQAASAGLLCSDAPRQYGGSAGTFLDQAVIIEEQLYTGCPAPPLCLHSAVIGPYLYKHATHTAREAYLRDFIEGRVIGSLALTEPSAGSDLQGIRTSARRDGDDWIINGSKIFITSGINCDICIVAAVTDRDAKSVAHGTSLFIVDGKTEGFIKGKNLRKIGQKGQDTSELFFEDVRVPGWSMVGGLNRGFPTIMGEIPQERLTIAVQFMASAETMFEDTRMFLNENHSNGNNLMSSQLNQHKMADMKIKICAARSFVDHCLDLHSTGDLNSSTASMAKVLATDVANKVAYDCLQLHGGYGYMEECPISRAYRDVRIGPIYGGTNEIMKELIARTIAA